MILYVFLVMKTFIVMPAYNEESKIVGVIKQLKNKGYDNIVIIDDGSDDNTFEKAKDEDVFVLRHVINRGQGAALKTGIDFSLLNNADVIITFDSDGQHDVNDIKSLINVIEKENYDVVLGSRFLKNTSNVPLVRKIFLKMGALLILFLYGVKLTDSHNGLRALSRPAAEKIEIRTDRMEHASEILEQISLKNLKYKEVPVTIKYTKYSLQHGQSTWNAFKILSKMLFRKLIQ